MWIYKSKLNRIYYYYACTWFYVLRGKNSLSNNVLKCLARCKFRNVIVTFLIVKSYYKKFYNYMILRITVKDVKDVDMKDISYGNIRVRFRN